jgi:PKHD-type hydroxylase
MTGCKFNKYDQDTQPAGGEYRRHTDAPWMGPVRTDFTVVLGLTDPDTYEGGDHFVEDPLTKELWEFRLNKGDCLVYETGYAHWVTPVTKGSRICALSWLESQVSDERQRGLLVTLRKLSQTMEAKMLENKDQPEYRDWFVDVGVVHSGLYRMWGHRQ